MDKLDLIATGTSWGAKALRILRSRRALVGIRNRAAISSFRLLHERFVHDMRKLEQELSDCDHSSPAQTGLAICNSCAVIMRNVCELPRNQLTCSIKLFSRTGDGTDRDSVVTWMRSEPYDNRDCIVGDLGDSSHEFAQDRPLASHSARAAIYGVNDGKTNWRKNACFACNDLYGCSKDFACSRSNWQEYYRSMLVFPMQYAKNPIGTEFANSGFLCFDSPKANGFLGVPDIYESSEPAEYRDRLEKCIAFHIGALMSDLLGSVFRVWDTPSGEGKKPPHFQGKSIGVTEDGH